MDKLLQAVLSRVVTKGHLELVTASGTRFVFGDRTGTPVTVRFTDRRAQVAFIADPDIRAGELFMDGRFIVERGNIYDFLYIVLSNTGGNRLTALSHVLHGIRFTLRRLAKLNAPRRAKSNVAHHYDLDARLYRLFLDPDLQYSCAYFERPGVSLAEAQLAKKRHIAAKLMLEPGVSVLDIGSGWGGMALYLATVGGADNVAGVTLSEEQIAIARERAEHDGLSERVTFDLKDYRAIEGTFDRIVSVGMFEHVGVRFYPAFFSNCARLLADDGVMLLHTIGFSDVPGFAAPWIDKYIFPGGYLPALSEIVPDIEKAGLVISDVEILQVHYAETLRAWRNAFMAQRAEAKALYDERFCRMWEFYLAASEAAFRCEKLSVFQIQLTKQPARVPTTRDYITRREQELRRREAAYAGGMVANGDASRASAGAGA